MTMITGPLPKYASEAAKVVSYIASTSYAALRVQRKAQLTFQIFS